MLKTLEELGIHGYSGGRNDLFIGEKKFSGSAQYTKNKHLVYHGCIMVSSNLEILGHALKAKKGKIRSKGAKSVISPVKTVSANTDLPVTVEDFGDRLQRQILQKNGREYHFTEKDIQEILRLRNEKYATWEWNYGYFADYEMVREEKFQAGFVTVYMNVQEGRIREIRFQGDFFGNGEIEELEKLMEGLRLDHTLEDNLSCLNPSYYISITAGELSRLLR